MAEPLLALQNLRAGYGDAVVLDDISLAVEQNGSLAVLGRNGVGKSTLFLTIMGFTRIGRGTITWRGKNITALAPHLRARAGIGWVAQEREIFPQLTVEENLNVAAKPGRWNLRAVFDLFPRIDERRGNKGNQLSGGEQQMLAIARALMTNPDLLLLDEPLEGLAPIIVDGAHSRRAARRDRAFADRERRRVRTRQDRPPRALEGPVGGPRHARPFHRHEGRRRRLNFAARKQTPRDFPAALQLRPRESTTRG